MKKIKNERGITLIALVITIIVLLILAGVSIATLTGENGILTRADDAKRETTKAEARERIQLEMAASFDNTGKYNVYKAIENLKNNAKIPAEDITKNDDRTLKVKLNGYEFPVDTDGRVGEGTKVGEIEEPLVSIIDYVKVGDYVDYEPTKTDVNRTQDVDPNKLTYISPVGEYSSDKGMITHGNGNREQIFTARPNDESDTGIKWRVLSVSEDKIELISDSLVSPDEESNFRIKDNIGYLYAEQELNEACKIYGYGYGADTSVESIYTVGGPEDEPIIGKIEGSGARSITVDDINKRAGVYEDKEDGKIKYKDGTVINSNYGSKELPTAAVNYPTLWSSNTSNPGQSGTTKAGFKYTYYKYKKDKIEDTVMQGILFKKQYWLASRCTHTRSEPNSANFLIRIVWNSSNVSAHLVPRGWKLPSSSTKNRISNSTYSNYKS